MKRLITFTASVLITDETADQDVAALQDEEIVEWIERVLTDEHRGIAPYQSAKVTLIPAFIDPYPEDS